jgi:lycopene cyclase domain-containing protein
MHLLYTHWAYALILCISLAGLILIDRRWHLVVFRTGSAAKKATLMTLAITTGFFLIWDIAGICLGIFFTNPRYTLGINLLTPNLPIEEVLFLILLVYSILIINASTSRYEKYQKRRDTQHHA